MADYQRTQTHVADGLARLLERFKGKPNMEGLVKVVLKRVQRIDDVIWGLYTDVWLDNAEGVQLDNLGEIVGEQRKGRQDEQYRTYIRARIAINRSNGKIADTLKVARLILEPDATVGYTPEYPAAYKVTVTNTAVPAADIAALLDEVRPAGVGRLTVVVPDNAFIFDTDSPLVNGFDNGVFAEGL